MAGVLTRIPGIKCEVGRCYVDAAYTEDVIVIPSNPELKNERHKINLVLCRRHEQQFQQDGLVGAITAYGDEIASVSC